MIDVEFSSLWQLWLLFAVLAGAGAVLVWRSVAAYRARPSRPLLLLATGMALITVGMPAVWSFSYLLTGDMFVCALSSSGTVLSGAAALVASVQMRAG